MKIRREKPNLTFDGAPTVRQLEQELEREQNKSFYGRILFRTVCTLVTVAAATILMATLFLPVLQIYGNSMLPVLNQGDIVVAVKSRNFQTGDIISFQCNNQILVKRVIARAGQWVNIDSDGNVYVDNTLLDEPYLTEKALGECDITLPYQVPDRKLFVMGDHRATSIDSRSSSVGCVEQEQIIGKLILCVWPFNNFGLIK